MPKLHVILPIRTFTRIFQGTPDGYREVAKSEIARDYVRELPPGHYRVDFCRIDEDGIEFTMADQDGVMVEGYPLYVCTMFGFNPRDDVDLPA